MEIVLDTSFILTCVKQKIDFFHLGEELFSEKLEWVVPLEVLKELETLAQRTGEKISDKESAETALQILKEQNVPIVPLENKNTDDGIVEYVKERVIEKPIIATIDKELKQRVQTLKLKVMVIRDMKSLGIE